MSAKDDDFVVVLLLLSHHFPLIVSTLSESKLKQFLPLSEIHKRDCHIPRCALLHPDSSPLRRLYFSCNEQPLITFTGLDYHSFGYLLKKMHLCIIAIHHTPTAGRLLFYETQVL
jgi:hypothetical protein